MGKLSYFIKQEIRKRYAMYLYDKGRLKLAITQLDKTTLQMNCDESKAALMEYLKEVGLVELQEKVINEVCFSDTQVRFIEDCEKEGKDWFMYSGRSMYGDYCPAIITESPTDNPSRVKSNWDNMGKQFVIYCDK